MKENKASRAEYLREWRKNNPIKHAELQAQYWARRLEKLRAEQDSRSSGERKTDG